jgi:hypothetical protein
MCPECISVIAVAVVAATPLSVVKTFLAHTAERFATPRETTVVSPHAKGGFRHSSPNRAPEPRLAWRVARRPQGIVG